MIGVVGGGAWGTALARLAARSAQEVALWVRDPERAAELTQRRENDRYLPGVAIPANVLVTTDLAEATRGRQVVVHAVPSHATREVAKAYAEHLDADAVVASATKGLEAGTNRTMSQLLEEITGRAVVALSGPNHAEEVGRDQPSAAVAAHPRYPLGQRVAVALGGPTFKVYPHPDRSGVEVCGAYKNVVAIATGMGAGLGYGDNTQAALITLGLHEMARLLPILGGERRTAYGLAGVGDLVATCTSRHSRNRFFGRRVGEGATVKETIDELGGKVVEGYYAARAFRELGEAHGLEMALTRSVSDVVEGRASVQEAMRALVALV